MQHRLLDLLWRPALALAAIASATVITVVLWRLDIFTLQHVAPFMYLLAVLICSWLGGYTAGITAVVLTIGASTVFTRNHATADPYRFVMLLLISCSVSWIEAHRRHVESELREGVESKTVELRNAIENLEREIQERKAAEEEVRRLNHLLELRVDERTRQLAASNQELESFSYTVSHDLRAPLRSIDGFSRILLASCQAKFSEEERSLFERVLAATGRMNSLIDDLLNLARVTRTAMHTQRVDLSQLAGRIASEFRRDHPESKTEFVVEPGISAHCDGGLMQIVLHNLLENAWKFSSQVPGPKVEFGATMRQGERTLFVKDNGAGFDPAYKSKLFAPFQRLHRQDEFPGTGIGLATVSRIVQRHGGRIEAESEPGQGATFFFTLADSQVHDAALTASYRPEEPKPPAPLPEAPSSSSIQSART